MRRERDFPMALGAGGHQGRRVGSDPSSGTIIRLPVFNRRPCRQRVLRSLGLSLMTLSRQTRGIFFSVSLSEPHLPSLHFPEWFPEDWPFLLGNIHPSLEIRPHSPSSSAQLRSLSVSAPEEGESQAGQPRGFPLLLPCSPKQTFSKNNTRPRRKHNRHTRVSLQFIAEGEKVVLQKLHLPYSLLCSQGPIERGVHRHPHFPPLDGSICLADPKGSGWKREATCLLRELTCTPDLRNTLVCIDWHGSHHDGLDWIYMALSSWQSSVILLWWWLP